jgi:nitroreductase
MNYDDLLELVQKRRSIKLFKPDPVPEEYIDKIIDVARWAPSSLNQQPWEFVVVTKPELRSKILEYCSEYFKLGRQMMNPDRSPQASSPAPVPGKIDRRMAPVFIVVFGDARTKEAEPKDLRCHPLTLQGIFHSSLAGAVLYLHLAATTLGLGSCWISVTRIPYPQCMIKNLLGIPEEMELQDVMMLGYPDMKPRPKRMREGKMVHHDQCKAEEFRTDEEVKDFYRRPVGSV